MHEAHFESHFPYNVREKELSQIMTVMKEGNCSQIISTPGGGRATILGLLSYNRAIRTKYLGEDQKKYHFVFIDFAEVKNRPMADITKFLFLQLIESLRDRRMEKAYASIKTYFSEALVLHDELVLFQGLKRSIEYLAHDEDIHIVFLFDNFDEYVPHITNTFFTNLSILRNRAQYRFSVVFALHRPLEQSVDPIIFADIYKLLTGHTVYLAVNDSPTIEFLLKHTQEIISRKLTALQKKTILHYTGGHEKMTRVCAEELLGTSGKLSDIKQFFLDNIAIRNVSYDIWGALQPQEHQLLKKIVLGEKVDEDSLAIHYLQSIGLLTQSHAYSIPLFEEFVRYRAKHLPMNKLTFRSETNDILRGDISLTENLTPSEFRLLKHLISYPEQILEREELIQVVWNDEKSTAGVTDQAIDQLIFRLRHKIEEEPNQPEHILTIKGRGIKFIS